MFRSLLLAVLTLWSVAFSVQARAPQPVVVQFGELLWLYAADGLPQIRDGVTFVPVQPMCELFGAKCTLNSADRSVMVNRSGNSQTLTGLTFVPSQGHVPYAPLKLLSAPLGFTYEWKSDVKRVNIVRADRHPGGLSFIQGVMAGQSGSVPDGNAPPGITVQTRTQTQPGDSAFLVLWVQQAQVPLDGLWTYALTNYNTTESSSKAGCTLSLPSTCLTNIPKTHVVLLGKITQRP